MGWEVLDLDSHISYFLLIRRHNDENWELLPKFSPSNAMELTSPLKT